MTAVPALSLVPFVVVLISHQLLIHPSSSASTAIKYINKEINEIGLDRLRNPLDLLAHEERRHREHVALSRSEKLTLGWSVPQVQQPSTIKVDQHNLLVAVLLSQSESLEQRNGARNTWKKKQREGTIVRFVVGVKGLGPQSLEDLKAERKKHQDIILLRDVSAESGRTTKLFHTFMWLERQKYSYALISKDDCFIRLDRVIEELQHRTHTTGLYWGYFVGNAVPQKSGMWAENQWFLCDRYSPYALAGGYVLSLDVIRRIMINSDLIQLYNNDDVSVGVWTSAFDIERRHDTRFDVEDISRGCRNDFLITCGNTADDILTKYNRLTETHTLCEEEGVVREYVYNWTAKASKCCQEITFSDR